MCSILIMAFRIEQLQSQTQVLAPHLRQSLKILQASALELRTVIQEELQMNPTLEELPNEMISIDEPSKVDEIDREYSSFDEKSVATACKHHDYLMDSLTSDVSLQDHLLEQVGCLDLPENLNQVVYFIIGSLNEKGFLEIPTEEIILQTRSNYETVNRGLQIVQQLDPIGVGHRDIASCLLAQLKHFNKENSIAAKILRQCYPLLLRNKIIDIAKKLSISPDEVQAAIKEDISCLDPTPGYRFSAKPSQGIIPDVRIYKNYLNEWCVELNNQYIPRLKIGDNYKAMLSLSNKTEDKNYLKLKIRSGRFLIQAILQRQKTIEQISRSLLHHQYLFFEQGPDFLKPLNLQVLADSIGIHETTVSRATSNKYVETPFGIYSFKYFFTKGLNLSSGECISSSIIKKQIQEIIETENKRKPLSDQKIVTLLNQKNVQIARRTVTKYREMLGIPATSLRRKYD